MKNLITIMALVACFMACKTENSKQAETKAPPPPPVETKAEVKTDTIQAHTYICPMDADITSTKAGEKCSKCGMKLVEKK
jgi:Heavy metal binding domain